MQTLDELLVKVYENTLLFDEIWLLTLDYWHYFMVADNAIGNETYLLT